MGFGVSVFGVREKEMGCELRKRKKKPLVDRYNVVQVSHVRS
jgi:ATP-dependent RNA circularization protein (DNA/RNA ligase family)